MTNLDLLADFNRLLTAWLLPPLPPQPQAKKSHYTPEGVKIPIQKRPLETKVPRVYVSQIFDDAYMESRRGHYFSGEGYKIVDSDCDIYIRANDGTEKLLAKLRKEVMSADIVKLAHQSLEGIKGLSMLRGAAAGPIDPKLFKVNTGAKRAYLKAEGNSVHRGIFTDDDGKIGKMMVSNPVSSNVIGFLDSKKNIMTLPCRLTNLTVSMIKNNRYKTLLPFIEAINNCFKFLTPRSYASQKAVADKMPALRIADTAFSSVTVNRNFRTGLHKDAGDYPDGFGNLTVVERGKYQGGYTLFPQYGIGIDLRAGDFLAMDVHQWHCNSELYETEEDARYNATLKPVYDRINIYSMGHQYKFSRISVVCYLRERLIKCDLDKAKERFNKINYNWETATITKPKRVSV